MAYDDIRTPQGRADNALGGSAIYFSLAARLFAPVRLVGVVGADFSEEDVGFLRARGIDTAGMERVPGGKTFRWAGEYSEDMNQRRTISVDLNVFENFQPKIPAGFRDSRLVFLANGSPVTQMSVLGQMAGPRFVVADTMDLWIENLPVELGTLLGQIDGFVVNDSEARLLTRRQNLLDAGRAIQALGPSTVVVKKGEHGAMLFHGSAVVPLPAFPVVDVRDPTGAGDSFAGAFMGYLSSRCAEGPAAGGGRKAFDVQVLKSAVAFGIVVASFTVEDFGVRRIAETTLSEVESRFEKYREFLKL
jgi:sugar/nucleoside kinase (ribokinase family)